LFLRCDAVNSDVDNIESSYSKLSHEYCLWLDKDAIK
jgi:hypothetical protein